MTDDYANDWWLTTNVVQVIDEKESQDDEEDDEEEEEEVRWLAFSKYSLFRHNDKRLYFFNCVR